MRCRFRAGRHVDHFGELHEPVQDTHVDLGVVIRDHELATRTPHSGAPSLPIASFSR